MDRGDPEVFARNVRAFRALRGLSVRDLSERSGVSTKTIVKIEHGEGCSVRTEQRIAAGFTSYLGRLWDASLLSDEGQRVIQRDTARWFFGDVRDAQKYFERRTRTTPEMAEERMRSDPDEIQVEAERHRLGRAGFSPCFVKAFGGGISSGYFQFNLAEIFGRDFTPPESFNYSYVCICNRGAVRFGIRGKEFEMHEGDSIVFEGNDTYWVEPLRPIGPTDLPPTIHFLCLHLLKLPKRR